jgi:hypothetical protein
MMIPDGSNFETKIQNTGFGSGNKPDARTLFFPPFGTNKPTDHPARQWQCYYYCSLLLC